MQHARGERRRAYKGLVGKLRGGDHFEDPGDNIKVDLRELDRSGSGQVAGSCKCGNEFSGSIKCGEFFG
jgi:hypothetical protein